MKNTWETKPKKFKKHNGFPIEDLWSLDHWLARELSKRLLAWIDMGPHGYPVNMTYEEWVSQLKLAAESLHNYSIDSDRYFDEGRGAMRWVSDNFEHLWD